VPLHSTPSGVVTSEHVDTSRSWGIDAVGVGDDIDEVVWK
jgi:hypothetical protein